MQVTRHLSLVKDLFPLNYSLKSFTFILSTAFDLVPPFTSKSIIRILQHSPLSRRMALSHKIRYTRHLWGCVVLSTAGMLVSFIGCVD